MKNYRERIANFFPNFKKELHNGVKERNPWVVIGQSMTMFVAGLWCLTIIGLIWGLPMILGCLKRLHKTKYVTWFHIFIAFNFFFIIGAIFTLIGILIDKRLKPHWY